MVIAGRLSMGHARGLLGLESDTAMERLARQTLARELSVRQVETLVRRERQEGAKRSDSDGAASATPPAPPSPAARDLVQKLEQALGTRVRLMQADATRGHLEISLPLARRARRSAGQDHPLTAGRWAAISPSGAAGCARGEAASRR